MKKRKHLLYKQILAAIISGGVLLAPNWGYALPAGGSVVSGSGVIGTPSGGVMNITGSGNVAIDWNSFGIGEKEIVNFSGMQAILNYVTGNTKSEIFGNLNGNLNGEKVHVFLVNPNGILFGTTAKVNVGQLTASTRSIANRKNFAGNEFGTLSTEAAKKVRGDLINLGQLTADQILLEGDNVSLLNADTLKNVSDKSKITLRANNKVTVGYEVNNDGTTIDVGDGKTHIVSNYVAGTGAKGSETLKNAQVKVLNLGDDDSKTITDAMLVHDVYELQAINTNVAGHYMLAPKNQDGDYIDYIDASATSGWNSGSGFKPLGNLLYGSGGFNGSLDGAGFSIENLHININTSDGTGVSAGLFDRLNAGSFVHNLTMVDVSINHSTNSSGSNVGSIAGDNLGTIDNVYNMKMKLGSISSKDQNASIGGIVGYNNGKITDAHNTGTVQDDNAEDAWIGGIAGHNGTDGVVNYADNAGAVSGSEDSDATGGIVGNNKGTINNSVNSGAVSSAGCYLGGIAGSNAGKILGSYNTGSIIGTDNNEATGGIIGTNDINDVPGTVDNVYNTGNIRSTGYNVAGIAGNNYIGTITNAYNTGNITGNGSEYAAGIVAINGAEISNVYNTGKVSGGSYNSDNIVGDNGGTVSNAYYAVWENDDISGYKAYTGGKLLTLADFNTTFQSGLDTAQTSWKFYNGYTTPLLKSFLKKVTLDADDIQAAGDKVYDGSGQTAELGAFLEGIHVGSKTDIGEYTLGDLLYSGQDGYDIDIINDSVKFKITEKEPSNPPEQPEQPEVQETVIYQTALVNVAASEKEHSPEKQNIKQRVNDTREPIKVTVKGDGIKIN